MALIVVVPPRRSNSRSCRTRSSFHLGGEAEVADFVEEQGAAVGELEATFLAGVRPGEGPFFVSEQLGLDQGFGQRGATHLDERPLGAHRIVVDGVGDQFLAGTRFAANQHVGIGRRHLGDLLVNLPHAVAAADNVGKIVALPKFPAQMLVLVSQAIVLAFDQVRDVDRLGDHGSNDLQEVQLAVVVAVVLEA